MTELVEQSPSIRSSISQLRRMQRSSQRNYRADNQTRTDVAIAYLDEQWGGRRNWLPPWPKGPSDNNLTFQELAAPDIFYLASISKIAVTNSVDLPSLY
jgi:hypothetical protein